jgi:hypothetical protein
MKKHLKSFSLGSLIFCCFKALWKFQNFRSFWRQTKFNNCKIYLALMMENSNWKNYFSSMKFLNWKEIPVLLHLKHSLNFRWVLIVINIVKLIRIFCILSLDITGVHSQILFCYFSFLWWNSKALNYVHFFYRP